MNSWIIKKTMTIKKNTGKNNVIKNENMILTATIFIFSEHIWKT